MAAAMNIRLLHSFRSSRTSTPPRAKNCPWRGPEVLGWANESL